MSRLRHCCHSIHIQGPPRTDNGNYFWIEVFYSVLNDTGRAGFVMANSAADARSSEQDLARDRNRRRKKRSPSATSPVIKLSRESSERNHSGLRVPDAARDNGKAGDTMPKYEFCWTVSPKRPRPWQQTPEIDGLEVKILGDRIVVRADSADL